MSNKEFWCIIDYINWEDIIEESKIYGINPNEIVESKCSIFNIGFLDMFLNEIYQKRELLKDIIIAYSKGRYGISNGFGLSDDGCWDLTAHIVGLGEEAYTNIKEIPEDVFYYKNNVVENFEYGICNAIASLIGEVEHLDDNEFKSSKCVGKCGSCTCHNEIQGDGTGVSLPEYDVTSDMINIEDVFTKYKVTSERYDDSRYKIVDHLSMIKPYNYMHNQETYDDLIKYTTELIKYTDDLIKKC